MNAIKMTADVQSAIARHARSEYPNECCGILLGTTAAVTLAAPAKNIAEPARLHDRYVIDPLAILRADKKARDESIEIVGFYHSHPNHDAVPSETDLSLAWADYLYVIATVTEAQIGEMRAWQFEVGDDPRKHELRIIVEN